MNNVKDNIKFIEDNASEFGLDVSVETANISKYSKDVYDVIIETNGHRFELVINEGELIHRNDNKIRELQNSLKFMKNNVSGVEK